MAKQIDFPEEFPVLESDRLNLTAFSPKDVDAYFALRSDKEFMKYLGLHPMRNKSEARDRVSSMIESFKRGEGISWKIALRGEEELIGYVGFWRIDFRHFRGEVGFGLHEDHQSQGYMNEALQMVLKFGFEELGLHSIMADVDPQNTSSIQLVEKLGFKKEAYLRENYYFDGDFLDSVYFGLLKKDL